RSRCSCASAASRFQWRTRSRCSTPPSAACARTATAELRLLDHLEQRLRALAPHALGLGPGEQLAHQRGRGGAHARLPRRTTPPPGGPGGGPRPPPPPPPAPAAGPCGGGRIRSRGGRPPATSSAPGCERPHPPAAPAATAARVRSRSSPLRFANVSASLTAR